jgi:microsomal epoxide hydrolase
MTNEPFKMPWSAAVQTDLRRRLLATRWNDAVTADWSQGTERAFLQTLVARWATYDWAARVADLNRLPHRRATVDGFGLHFLHFRSRARDPIPLLLMNGWPSSFLEYQRLAPLLAQGAPAFDVVLPALPGFGYSDRPARPYAVAAETLFPKLMTGLGYSRFIAAGTDIGSGVATRIALHHPERVIGLHISAVAPKPRSSASSPLSAAEDAYAEAGAIWDRDEGGYQALQSSRPQTLAFALADSPTGLASWIVEKYRAWSDCAGDVLSVFPDQMLLDTLTLYWTTESIGSSVRYYYDAQRLRPPLRADDFVQVPTAIGMWPHDLMTAPREAAERLYNTVRYTRFPRGGHFPAWEAPDFYAEDLRAFAAGLTRA